MILLPRNHEYPIRKHVRRDAFELFHLWRPQFTLPENGPDCLKETTYSIDFQGAKVVMLNGNEEFAEQAKRLDWMLTENTQTWTIVGIHQPFSSSGKHRKNSRLTDLLIPILDEHAVDLVLQGHEHLYCRSYKLRNGKRVAPGEKGTVYVVSICGPKFSDATANSDGLMAKIETGRQFFQMIRIEPDRLLFESFDVMGVKHDSFSFQKDPHESIPEKRLFGVQLCCSKRFKKRGNSSLNPLFSLDLPLQDGYKASLDPDLI